MYNIIDTHCHLDIVEKQGLPIKDALNLAQNAGVKSIIQIGIDKTSSIRAKEISETFSSDELQINFTLGLHPTDIKDPAEALDFKEMINTSIELPNFTGIGEIGLDLYHSKDHLNDQEKVLDQMLSYAEEFSLPVVIHSREAAEETYHALKNFRDRVFGVIHCFTYDYEYAKKFIDIVYYISFSGIVEFKNAKDIQEAAAKIPLDTILIETDAPFLSPPPNRGKRNDSSNMTHILEKMISLRQEAPVDVEKKIYNNSLKFMRRKDYHA